MAASSTSFRLSDRAKRRLSERAEREGVSATALLERLIIEGVDTLDHPGIVHRGPPTDRRAALAAGPDVWEIVAQLRELRGSEEDRIATLSAESNLHPRQIRIALEFAARHSKDVEARIARNERAISEGQQAARQRRALLG
jgi:sarcosine oxidase gamma subunit